MISLFEIQAFHTSRRNGVRDLITRPNYSVLTIACSISPVPSKNRLDKIAEAKHIRVDWKQPESWALSGAGTGPQEARMAEPLQGHHKYARVQDLGAGSFGIVQLAVNRLTKEKVAIKFMPRGAAITQYVIREVLAHSQFSHPHVVYFREVFLTPTHLGLAMEYISGGTLYEYVRDKGALPENQARWFFQQLVVAVDYCHRKGFVNRDIKLENTLLDENRRLIKITDFGYAKSSEDSLPISNVGTPNYAAPEVIASSNKRYSGESADVWSCGVVLFVMLFHCYPFERSTDPKGARGFKIIMERTLRVDYHIPTKYKCSPEVVNLVGRMLQKDPTQRITISQLYDDPWFKKDFPDSARNLNDLCLNHKLPEEQRLNIEVNIKRLCKEATVVLPVRPASKAAMNGNTEASAMVS